MSESSLDNELSRIARWEPAVRAFVDFDEGRAREAAARCAAGPLAGWSVAVKDIIDVAGMATRCGSTITSAEPVKADAAVVARLKALGAFVMGKSVTTTFAYFDAGPTRNPWRLDCTPGGSSSGSAAAVAAGFVRLGIGTQTGGSIGRPAAYCGVVAIKPTFGTLPTEGVFPLAPSLDTVGLFAGNVGDVRVAMGALLGRSHSVSVPEKLRVGVLADLGVEPADAAMLAAVDSVARRLREGGHEVHVVATPGWMAEAHACHGDLMAAEVAASHAELFAKHRAEYTPKLTELIEKGRGVSVARLAAVMKNREASIAALRAMLERYDVLLTPSAPGAALRGLAVTGDHRMNRLWTYTGFPAVTLPAALNGDGLPLGVQLVGKRGEDLRLLDMAAVVEAAIGFTQRPQFNSGDMAHV